VFAVSLNEDVRGFLAKATEQLCFLPSVAAGQVESVQRARSRAERIGTE
jgi:hypothetical protein